VSPTQSHIALCFISHLPDHMFETLGLTTVEARLG